MFLSINPTNTDSMTEKHIISSNFGYLMANTTKADFFEKLCLNMQYLSSYLIDSNLISISNLKMILDKQVDNEINHNYSVINMFKGDDLIKPCILFQLSNIIYNLDEIFYQKRTKIKILKLDRVFKKYTYKKQIEQIYNSFFHIHKNKYFHLDNYSLKVFEIKSIIEISIENIIYSKDREIQYLTNELIIDTNLTIDNAMVEAIVRQLLLAIEKIERKTGLVNEDIECDNHINRIAKEIQSVLKNRTMEVNGTTHYQRLFLLKMEQMETPQYKIKAIKRTFNITEEGEQK